MLSRSTEEAPRHSKVSYWNDLAAELFSAIETKPVRSDAFEANVRWTNFGGFRIARVSSQPAQVLRLPRHITRAREQRYFLHVQIDGTLAIAQDGKEAILSNGDLALTDSALPYTLSYPGYCSTIVLVIPPEEIHRRLPCAEDLLAVKLPGDNGLSHTTSGILRSVWARAESSLQPEIGASVAASLLDVFAAAWIDIAGFFGRESAAAFKRRVLVRRFIEANLRDPELKPSAVAAEFGISPRYLHIIFANEGETLSRYILRRRLEECAKQLADDKWRGRTITEIAFEWGFNNATHFARVFKEHYGLAPRDYRNIKTTELGQHRRKAAIAS